MSAAVETSSRAEAEQRAQNIRDGLTYVWEQVAAAYAAEDWKTLGYASWSAYCAGEYEGRLPRLPRDARAGVVQSLADADMPIKAIAAATGIARNTVRGDLRADAEEGQIDPAPMARDEATRHALAARAALDEAFDAINRIREERVTLRWARDNHPDPDAVATAVSALRLIEHEDGTEISDAEHMAVLGLAIAAGDPSPDNYLNHLHNRKEQS